MLQLSGVEVEVKKFRLRNISFEVNKGKCLVILGPSGSGKTVLLNTIAGFYRVKKGRIALEGRDITLALPEKRRIGYIPQNLALFPHLSVMDNILFGARSRRMPLPKARDKAKELARLLNIEHLLDRPSPSGLSGGERQRVVLARTLLVEPSVILFDEPLSALDSFIRRKLVLYLKQIFDALQVTAVYVTHDLEEAFLLADYIGLILDGKLQQVGRPEDVYYHPASLRVAQLFGSRNLFRGVITGCQPGNSLIARTSCGLECELPWRGGFDVGQKVVFGISPREVVIIRRDRPLHPKVQTNIFTAKVTHIFESYGSCLVFVAVEEGSEKLEMEIPNYIFRDMGLSVGAMVEVSLKKDCLWVLPDDQVYTSSHSWE